jgi:rRNA maturation endonuclease Nob1
MTIGHRYEVEKECFCCEVSFTVLSDNDDIEYCPFCGERLEDEYSERDDDDTDESSDD